MRRCCTFDRRRTPLERNRPIPAPVVSAAGLRLENRRVRWHDNLYLAIEHLAGCETGIADFAESGEEGGGLGTAFLSAGAQVVVGVLWKVPDLATTLLFTDFYARLLAGRAADRALTEASENLRSMSYESSRSRRQDLRLDATEIGNATALSGNTDFPFSHPLFWGGFILMVSPLSTAFDPVSRGRVELISLMQLPAPSDAAY